MPAVIPQRVFGCLARLAQQRADSRRGFEQACCLGVNDLLIARFAGIGISDIDSPWAIVLVVLASRSMIAIDCARTIIWKALE
jgi:hypothetical protein